jgi:hypothetical protein
MKAILASLMIMSASVDKEIKFRPNITLDQQHQLTTNGGVLNPNEIIKLKANDYVSILLPDGTKFSGMVTKTEFKNQDHFECFGEIYSHGNTGFGFVLTKTGVFAGAVVERNADVIYNVTYSKEADGYVLVKRLTLSPVL